MEWLVSAAKRRRTAFLLLPAVVAVAAGPARAQLHGEVGVLLKGGALFTDLEIHAKCVKGKWERTVSGYPGGVANATEMYRGTLQSGEATDDRIRLEVSFTMDGASVPYDLDLKLNGSSLSGQYSGTYMSLPVSGEVDGDVIALSPDHVAVAPGEHPRLFFRKNQLEWLRRKAGTPQGERILVQLRRSLPLDRKGFGWADWFSDPPGRAANYGEGLWAGGHALMWALYEDEAELQRAKQITIEAMVRRDSERMGPGSAQRWLGVAIAYDLCYEGWGRPFTDTVYQFLRELSFGRNAVYTPTKIIPRVAKMQAAGGLCALAMLDDPVARPPKPPSPAQITRTIHAPADYSPGAGVPVVPFIRPEAPSTSGNMPKQWLWAGGFTVEGDSDPLGSIGGSAGARPEQGTTVTYRGQTYEFRPTSDQQTTQKYGYYFRQSPPNPAIDMYGARGGCRPDFEYALSAHCLNYYYTVIDNEKERAAVARPNSIGNTYGVTMWIAGERVGDGEVFRLERGKYPVMVAVPLMGLWVAPMLTEYTDAVYQNMLKEWRKLEDDHTVLAGTTGFGTLQTEKRARWCAAYGHEKISSNGRPDLSSGVLPASDMIWHMLPFAQAYLNVTGKDFAAGTGIPMLIPWVMGGGDFSGDYGSDHWRVHGHPGLLPERYRAQLKDRMEEESDLGAGWLPVNALFALVNYPWDDPMPPPEAATTWTFRGLPEPSGKGEHRSRVTVYDCLGRRLGGAAGGPTAAVIDLRYIGASASGLYIAELRARGGSIRRRLMVR